eukprot:Skav230059  [mRNA]  locus=scaffold1221:106739:112951:+ [translate_table: standard]
MAKWVYDFGDGKADGRAEMKNLLGGKGANLAEMASIGLPVPPGFTITTEFCTHFYQNGCQYPKELEQQAPPKQIYSCRRIGARRRRLCRKRRPRPRGVLTRFCECIARWLRVFVKAQAQVHTCDVRPQVFDKEARIGEGLPNAYRGGGRAGGSQATVRRRHENLQDLLKQVAEPTEEIAVAKTASAKAGGKGKQAKPAFVLNSPEAKVEYGLLEALQTLTNRARKKPQGLLARLQT